MFEQKFKKFNLFNLLKIIKQHSNNLKIPKPPKSFQASQVENINIYKEFSKMPNFFGQNGKTSYVSSQIAQNFLHGLENLQCEQFYVGLDKPHHIILSIPFV
jgi:hypothetical protein